jgi:enolase-phosphatase E1
MIPQRPPERPHRSEHDASSPAAGLPDQERSDQGQQKSQRLVVEGVSHVLLDIEGTTCPVSFVSETLFPYASDRLPELLSRRDQDPEVQRLIQEVDQAWSQDPDPEAQGLRHQAPEDVGSYLQGLMRRDRKLSPLKELQGLIWTEGYRKGELVGPLYDDVPGALQRWNQQGLVLAVYSSGSVRAQQLLYGYSRAGDLRPLFSHWFDTRTGAKQNRESYIQIARTMAVKPSKVLFISDALAELEAASTAGMTVLFSQRPGNGPGGGPGGGCGGGGGGGGGPFQSVGDFSRLVLLSG